MHPPSPTQLDAAPTEHGAKRVANFDPTCLRWLLEGRVLHLHLHRPLLPSLSAAQLVASISERLFLVSFCQTSLIRAKERSQAADLLSGMSKSTDTELIPLDQSSVRQVKTRLHC